MHVEELLGDFEHAKLIESEDFGVLNPGRRGFVSPMPIVLGRAGGGKKCILVAAQAEAQRWVGYGQSGAPAPSF